MSNDERTTKSKCRSEHSEFSSFEHSGFLRPSSLFFNTLFIFQFLSEFSPMRRAIYPGSFDPVTNGHLDVIERARKLFDEVVVAVAHNDQKHPLFTLEERLGFLRGSLGKIKNVEVAPLDGLL